MEEPKRPTLAYRRIADPTVRGPRSVSMTLFGAVVGIFAGLMAGWFALMAIVGPGGPPSGRLVLFVVFPSIAIGAVVGGLYFGRGKRVRLIAAKRIEEDLVYCRDCDAETWHVIRTYNAQYRSIECLNCQSRRWL
jgi:hypothetical protein